MQLSNVRVISLYDQIFPQRLLCLGICQPFLGSWKINPTWFLPSDSSQLLAKESSTRTKRALSLTTSRGQHEIRVIKVLRTEGPWIPTEETPSRAWGRLEGQGAGDMTDAPINTRFGAWGLCLGLGRRGHRPAGGAAPRAAGGGGRGAGRPAGPAEHLGERPRQRPRAKHRVQPARRSGFYREVSGGPGRGPGARGIAGPALEAQRGFWPVQLGWETGVTGRSCPFRPHPGGDGAGLQSWREVWKHAFPQHICLVETGWPAKAPMARSHLCSL